MMMMLMMMMTDEYVYTVTDCPRSYLNKVSYNDDDDDDEVRLGEVGLRLSASPSSCCIIPRGALQSAGYSGR